MSDQQVPAAGASGAAPPAAAHPRHLTTLVSTEGQSDETEVLYDVKTTGELCYLQYPGSSLETTGPVPDAHLEEGAGEPPQCEIGAMPFFGAAAVRRQRMRGRQRMQRLRPMQSSGQCGSRGQGNLGGESRLCQRKAPPTFCESADNEVIVFRGR